FLHSACKGSAFLWIFQRKREKNTKKARNVCIIQKKAVNLQPILRISHALNQAEHIGQTVGHALLPLITVA
ncbi:MAG: hypothetical protein SPE88_02415, partial [Paludibacteraceae bacterium]|nr:hypothetical protein [Paludibacteraceae bacterium]